MFMQCTFHIAHSLIYDIEDIFLVKYYENIEVLYFSSKQKSIWKNLYIYSLNEETWENEVADVHLNVPWAQQAEEKSLNVGCQKQTLQFMKIFILNFF